MNARPKKKRKKKKVKRKREFLDLRICEKSVKTGFPKFVWQLLLSGRKTGTDVG